MATENKEKAKGEAIFPLTQEQINQIAAIGAKEGVRAYKEEQKKEERRRKKEDSKVRKTKKLLSSYRRIKATLSDGEQFTPEEQAELRWKFIEDLLNHVAEQSLQNKIHIVFHTLEGVAVKIQSLVVLVHHLLSFAILPYLILFSFRNSTSLASCSLVPSA